MLLQLLDLFETFHRQRLLEVLQLRQFALVAAWHLRFVLVCPKSTLRVLRLPGTLAQHELHAALIAFNAFHLLEAHCFDQRNAASFLRSG